MHSKAAIFMIITLLFAGCSTNEKEGTTPAISEEIRTHEFMVNDENGHRWILEVSQDATLNVSAISQKTNEKTPLNECGQIVSYYELDGKTQSAASISWFESRGRVVSAKTDASGTIEVPLASAQESLALTVSRNKTNEIEVPAGTKLVVDLMQGTSSGNSYSAKAVVQGKFVEIVDHYSLDFECGANISEFEGTHVMTGMAVGSQVAVDGVLSRSVENENLSISFFTIPDPRFAGVCELGILVDGQIVDTDSNSNDYCVVSHRGEVMNSFSLEITNSLMVAPVFGYFISPAPLV
jgi:hypothetical protein